MAIPFTDRARLLVSRGMYGATQNVYCGLNDFEDMSFVLHYLRQDDIFLDVGANIGAYTVLARPRPQAREATRLIPALPPSIPCATMLRSTASLISSGSSLDVSGRAPGTVSVSTGGPCAMHHIGN